MNVNTGEIRSIDKAEAEKLLDQKDSKGNSEWVKLTPGMASFFRSKSSLFRECWGSRLARGLKPDEQAWLDEAVAAHEAAILRRHAPIVSQDDLTRMPDAPIAPEGSQGGTV
jgi:hypothetical protein